ncbi:MAG: hypothetical protein ACRC6U_01180 [Fusobacteriaceae bacterium]
MDNRDLKNVELIKEYTDITAKIDNNRVVLSDKELVAMEKSYNWFNFSMKKLIVEQVSNHKKREIIEYKNVKDMLFAYNMFVDIILKRR